MNYKTKGEITEVKILARLIEQGYSVSLPFGDNQRYDMIVDTGEQLLRAQCKTGRYRNGCVVYNLFSVSPNTNITHNYIGQVDIFLVYCPELDKYYWVPIDEGTSTKKLRVDDLKIRSGKTSWGRDYEW